VLPAWDDPERERDGDLHEQLTTMFERLKVALTVLGTNLDVSRGSPLPSQAAATPVGLGNWARFGSADSGDVTALDGTALSFVSQYPAGPGGTGPLGANVPSAS
jgi:hypothetical protein